MRFSRRKLASDGGEDQDGDQNGGGSGQAQTGGYRRRIRIFIRIIYVLKQQ